MYSVSDIYKQEMVDDLRGESSIEVAHSIPNIHNDEVTTSFQAGLNVSDVSLYFSSQVQSANGEPSGCFLDGSYFLRVEPTNPFEDNPIDEYVSEKLSASDKTVTGHIYYIHIAGTVSATDIPEFIFIKFDDKEMFKATKLLITMENGAHTPISSVVEYNEGVEYDGFSAQLNLPTVTPGQEANLDYIKIEIKETNLPYAMVRFDKVILGTVNEFTSSTIESATWVVSSDPLTFSVPNAELSFTFLDPEKIYHESNVTGKLDDIVENQKVGFRFGYALQGGGVEWVNGGLYRTTGEKSVSEDIIPKVTVKARHLSVMADDFVKDLDISLVSEDDESEVVVSLAEESHSLKSLFSMLDVVTNLELVETSPGVYTNVIDTFTVIDGNIKVKEYAQLMCNACGLIWRIDRTDSVTESITLTEFTELNMTSDDAYDSLAANVYEQGADPFNPLPEEFTNKFGDVYLFQFNNSNLYELPRISSVPTSDGISFSRYDHLLNDTLRSLYPIDAAGTRFVKIDNPFLTTNYASANTEPNVNYEDYVWKYFQEHKTYTLINRGFPELDVGDIIHLYINYYEEDGETIAHTLNKRCIVVSNKIEYAGGIRGETVVLEWDIVLGD